ncbi:MAG: hypothetical protein WD341_14115 [Tistlia sp.]|uniref:hypothetical protein n=1 Tax=Tistlia sp. TaxID=3057121 RepID=UPI0034A21FAB
MNPVTKKREAARNGSGRPQPPLYDYSDQVTDEHLSRIDELVDQDKVRDMEVVSGPGW